MAKAVFWRGALGVTNLLIFSASLVLLVGTVLIFLRSNELVEIAGQENFKPIAITYIAGGLFVVLVTFLGCFGAFKGSIVVLVVFALLMLAMVVVQVAGAFVCTYYYSDQVQSKTRDWMEDSMRQYSSKQSVRNAWDRFQTEMECCGVDGPPDWIVKAGTSIPPSCCRSGSDGVNCHVENDHFDRGCLDKVHEAVEDNLRQLIVIGFLVTGFELMNVLFALCAICGLRKSTTYA